MAYVLRGMSLSCRYWHTILYIEAVDTYVKVHLTAAAPLLSKIPLTTLERQLPEAEFIRIHRSYIVCKSRIATYSRSYVTLAPSGRSLPVGKKYAAAVLALG